MRYFLILPLLWFMQPGFAQKANDSQLLKDQLQQTLNELIAKHETPGITFSVVMPDGELIAVAAGKANLESDLDMRPEDRMLGGSTGKVFYSVVIMQLVEEGKLSLDEPISTYLGHYEWFKRVPNAEGLTLRNLMRHESGIPRYVFKEAFQSDVLVDADKKWEPQELVAYVLDDEPLFEVNSSFAYSDTNYILAGMAVEEVTGNDLFDEVENRVVKRAGLKYVDYQNKRTFKGMAQGYNGDDPFFPGHALAGDKSRYNWQFEWAGGGIVIASQDLAILAKKIYEGEMFSPELLPAYLNGRDALQMGGTWGLGVHIRETPNGRIFGHSGFMPGYITNMFYWENEQVAICYQINGSAPAYRGIMREIPQVNAQIREFINR